MAVENRATAEEVARFLSDCVRDDPLVQRLYISAPRDDVTAVWLVTVPADYASYRRLYELALPLYERFPDNLIDFHVVNPREYVNDVRLTLPPDATELPLRSA